MAKIWTTLAASYLNGRWGAWEFVREMIQNGRDAEVEHGAKLTVEWKNGTLRIENAGCTLPIKALLQGYTTKTGKAELIGKFGEGFSLGLVAGLREGFDIKIRNGSEVWVPSAERSEQFGEDVLVMNVSTGREYQNRVRVEIGGFTKEAWDVMKDMFLFLPRGDVAKVETHAGTLLLGEGHKGQVFVKGIFVQAAPDALYGYDFTEVELDRDRKMIESYNLRYQAKEVLLAAIAKTKGDLHATFYEALSSSESPALEMAAIGRYDAIHKDAVEYVAAKFVEDHGADAVPVANLAEAKDVEHYGKKGVVVCTALAAVLARKIGDFDSIKKALAQEVVSTYHRGHLSVSEKEVLDDVLSLVCDVERLSETDVTVVAFRSDSLLGQFANGRILIARKCLGDFGEALAVVIHEVAHRKGGDGDHAHIARVEQIWKGVVARLRRSIPHM